MSEIEEDFSTTISFGVGEYSSAALAGNLWLAFLFEEFIGEFSIHIRNDHPTLNALAVSLSERLRIPYWNEMMLCHAANFSDRDPGEL
jgi:hypothetical protein